MICLFKMTKVTFLLFVFLCSFCAKKESNNTTRNVNSSKTVQVQPDSTLTNEPSVTATDNQGKTPLSYAQESGNQALIDLVK